ncbi:DNA ligase [Streptomyces canus]|uniref:ATP-dependent DNA ligase n=1 Tax=Streptomyces canus TaxID=58343 RepID=UPI002E26CAF6
MDDPVRVALAQASPVLPVGGLWWYEPKFDGHRAVLLRDREGTRLQSRSGRIVTPQWMDVALAGMALLPGTTLDGELVVWNGGRLDWSAVQSRASSTPARARRLAEELPASYAVWDCIEHPAHGDVRGRPYVERRRLLLEVLADIGPPIQAVPATDDVSTALDWFHSLRSIGIEGVVAKLGTSAYRTSGRVWVKVRHSEPVDGQVVGYTGPRTRPRALIVQLPDGRRARSQRLTAPLSAEAAALLPEEEGRPLAQTRDGERYVPVGGELVAEVLAATTRHRVVTVTRLRPAETS